MIPMNRLRTAVARALTGALSHAMTGAVLLLTVAGVARSQTPQPFPKPGQAARPAPTPAVPAAPAAPTAPATPAPIAQAPAPAAPAAPASAGDDGAPAEAELGLPVFPGARFLTSYDAGRGQRFYLFGTTGTFAELVAFYRTSLKEKGSLVFEQPPTHTFEVVKFREETMAFPPGVTVKDYSWGGSAGYPNPKRGGQPERFPTIIQIVPAPAAGAPRK